MDLVCFHIWAQETELADLSFDFPQELRDYVHELAARANAASTVQQDAEDAASSSNSDSSSSSSSSTRTSSSPHGVRSGVGQEGAPAAASSSLQAPVPADGAVSVAEHGGPCSGSTKTAPARVLHMEPLLLHLQTGPPEAWQILCRHHGGDRSRCTKTATFLASSQSIIRRMKFGLCNRQLTGQKRAIAVAVEDGTRPR